MSSKVKHPVSKSCHSRFPFLANGMLSSSVMLSDRYCCANDIYMLSNIQLLFLSLRHLSCQGKKTLSIKLGLTLWITTGRICWVIKPAEIFPPIVTEINIVSIKRTMQAPHRCLCPGSKSDPILQVLNHFYSL